MSFSTEALNREESMDSRSLPINETYKLTHVADTIQPTAPQRVEGAVPVQQTPVQSKPVLEDNEAREADDDTQQTPHQTVSTAQQVRPATPAPSATVSVRSDSVAPVFAPRVVNNAATFVLPADTLVASDSLKLAETKAERKGMSTYTLDTQKEGIALPIKLDRSDGVFALLVLCFLILAHVYRGGFLFFRENIMHVFSVSKSEKLETLSTTKEVFNSFFLVFLSILLVSISLYEGLDRFMPLAEETKRPFVTIALFIICIFLFILIKLMLNRFIGYMFDLQKQIHSWNQSYIVLLSLLGLLCFFPTLLLVYSNMWHTVIIGFVLVLLILVQLILFTRIIIFFIGQRFNFLYLIAYLCTIEILPYIFLGIGLIYLYQIDVLNTTL